MPTSRPPLPPLPLSHRLTQRTLPPLPHPPGYCSYITPPGHGFLPRETALHHQHWAVKLVQQALEEAGVGPADISCIAYTKVRCLGGSGVRSGLYAQC